MSCEQCPAVDTHYGSHLTCQALVDHEGPHWNGGASWPDEDCHLCAGKGSGGPLSAGGRCTKCNGTGRA